MFVRGIRTAALAVAPIALMAAGMSPAAAAGAATTERFSYADCMEWDDDGTRYCWSAEGRVHYTTTRSGNESGTLRGTFADRIIAADGEVLAGYVSEEKAHWLVKRGQDHVFTLKSEGVATTEGETCAFSLRLHYANGAVRVERIDADCEG